MHIVTGPDMRKRELPAKYVAVFKAAAEKSS
jgi:hypothetical protein